MIDAADDASSTQTQSDEAQPDSTATDAMSSSMSSSMSPPMPPVIGYEQARDELVAVVAKLEAGRVTLEESITLWERGEELAKICQDWLDGARARLDAVIAARGDRNPGDQP